MENQLKIRFEQREFQAVCDMEEMLLNAANGRQFDIPKSLAELYVKDINLDRLKIQLKMLPDFMKAVNETVKDITNVRTICDALTSDSSMLGKKMLSEVATILQIYLTLPVTTSTAERSFSVLRRLKTWLRSTMTQERMNNLLLLHVHKTLTDTLDLKQIADEFSSVNERRIQFFGSFKQ